MTRYLFGQASLEYCTTGTFFDEFAEECKLVRGWEGNILILLNKCLPGRWASQVDCADRGQVDLGFEDDIIRRFQLF